MTERVESTGGRRLTRAWVLRAGGARAGSAVAAAALAACGVSGGGAPAGTAAQPATLSWMTDWAGGSRGEATKQSMAAFAAQAPLVKLELEATKDDTYTALSTHLAAGTLADVVLFSGNFFELWAERNVFADIGPALKKNRFDRESVWWEPQYVEHKGKVHGLPYQFTISTWIYNKTWFRRDNVPLPTDAWTTDDLLEVGRRLNHPDDNRYAVQIGAAPNNSWVWFYANGVDLTSAGEPIRTVLEQPKQLEVLQYAVDMIHRHRVAPITGGANAVRGLTFEGGGLAMAVNNMPKSLVATVQQQFEWDVMPTPRWAGTKRRATNWNHQGQVVTKAAEQRGRVDAGTQFIAWLAGEGGQTIIANTGAAVPVHKKTAYSPVYLDGSIPNLRLQLDLLEKKPDQQARGFRIWRHFMPWNGAITPVLSRGFNGEIGVREMATLATQAGDAALDAAKNDAAWK